MNYNINSSGLYNVNAYNLIATNATVLSSLTVNGSTLATNTNVNNLSTYTKLNIDNLNATSTTIFNNLNSLSTYTKLNIDNLNATSTTLLTYINNLTNPSTLNVNNLNVSGTTKLNGATTCISSFNVSGITTLSNKTIINGVCNIHGGNPLAVLNNHMQKGSLTIGDMSLNYGGGNNWNTNTSGLMLECLDNTEIAVHDAGQRITSLMYFEGGSTNKITIGRNMFWGALSDVVLNGNVSFTNELKSNYWKFTNQSDYCRLYNIAGTGYFNFAAKQLYAAEDLSIGTTASIGGSLNVSGTTKLNNATTINSSLNVKGGIVNEGLNIVDSSSYASQYQVSISPPTATTNSKIQTIRQGFNYNQILDLQPIGGSIILSGQTTAKSTLHVVGTTNCNDIYCSRIYPNGITVNDSSSAVNQYQLLLSPPTLTTNSTLQTIQQNVGFNQVLELQKEGGSIRLSGNTTCRSSLNVSGATLLNNNTTINSSLNVSGVTTLNNYTIINGSTQLEPKILLSGQEYLVPYQTSTDGIALLLGANRTTSRLLFIGDSTKLIQNTTNPIVSISPTGRFDCTSTDSTTRLPAVFNGALYTNGTFNITCISSLNISGFTTLSNNTTINSSLNVSGITTLNNFTTINAPLYINSLQMTTTSCLSVNCTSYGVLVNIVNNGTWNDGVNYALNVTGYSMFGGIQINGQDTNNIYKRVGDLTIASPSLNSIILKN